MKKKNPILRFLSTLITNYSEDKITTWSAALSYYTIFSLAPILLMSLTALGWFLGSKEAEIELLDQVNNLLGRDITLQIQVIIDNARIVFENHTIKLIGIGLLLFAASGFFSELHGGLNYIWRVELKPSLGILKNIKNRMLPFLLVLVITGLLLASIIISAALTALSAYYTHYLGINTILERSLEFLSSLLLIAVLSTVIFQMLPNVILRWRDVWLGACVTSILFNIGKMLLNVYFSYTNIASIFGAAGSLVVFLVWIYYSAQIFFLGAEITKIISLKHHKKILPGKDAVLVAKRYVKKQ